MTQTYSAETAGVDSLPVVKAAANQGYEAHLIRFRATVALASQAIGDTVVLADIPTGYVFAGGELTSSVSLSTSTVAVGAAGATGKYRAAAAFTAVDTPTPFGVTAQMAGAASSAPERVILTVAALALPAAGTLVVDLYFSHPN
jgi:hypothetical protein